MTTPYVDTIMEEVQVFASAWSLVGGVFDFGHAMEDAEKAKEELRALVSKTLDAAIKERLEALTVVPRSASKVAKLPHILRGRKV